MKPVPASAPPANFDRLARCYRALEYLALGRTLEAARFHHLNRLGDRRNILIFGEGDGRCLARLVESAPTAHVTCVDASPAMLDRAARRLAPPDRKRVTFCEADARTLALPAGVFDAVLTMFFLDCFTDREVRELVARISAALMPGAFWLYADFMLPAGGAFRLRSRLWLTVLYVFFRWTTGIGARRLPDVDAAFAAAQIAVAEDRILQKGLVRTSLLRLTAERDCPSSRPGICQDLVRGRLGEASSPVDGDHPGPGITAVATAGCAGARRAPT